MSLSIRLKGKKRDYNIFETASVINEKLKEIGISDYQFYPKNIPDDVPLPWLNLAKRKINQLKNLFLELKSNPNWTPNSDSLLIDEEIFFLI